MGVKVQNTDLTNVQQGGALGLRVVAVLNKAASQLVYPRIDPKVLLASNKSQWAKRFKKGTRKMDITDFVKSIDWDSHSHKKFDVDTLPVGADPITVTMTLDNTDSLFLHLVQGTEIRIQRKKPIWTQRDPHWHTELVVYAWEKTVTSDGSLHEVTLTCVDRLYWLQETDFIECDPSQAEVNEDEDDGGESSGSGGTKLPFRLNNVKDKTATKIIKQLAKEFNFPLGKVVTSNVKIGSKQIKDFDTKCAFDSSSSVLEIIFHVLRLTKDKSGRAIAFNVHARNGKVNIFPLRKKDALGNRRIMKFTDRALIESCTLTSSFEAFATQYILTAAETKVYYTTQEVIGIDSGILPQNGSVPGDGSGGVPKLGQKQFPIDTFTVGGKTTVPVPGTTETELVSSPTAVKYWGSGDPTVGPPKNITIRFPDPRTSSSKVTNVGRAKYRNTQLNSRLFNPLGAVASERDFWTFPDIPRSDNSVNVPDSEFFFDGHVYKWKLHFSEAGAVSYLGRPQISVTLSGILQDKPSGFWYSLELWRIPLTADQVKNGPYVFVGDFYVRSRAPGFPLLPNDNLRRPVDVDTRIFPSSNNSGGGKQIRMVLEPQRWEINGQTFKDKPPGTSDSSTVLISKTAKFADVQSIDLFKDARIMGEGNRKFRGLTKGGLQIYTFPSIPNSDTKNIDDSIFHFVQAGPFKDNVTPPGSVFASRFTHFNGTFVVTGYVPFNIDAIGPAAPVGTTTERVRNEKEVFKCVVINPKDPKVQRAYGIVRKHFRVEDLYGGSNCHPFSSFSAKKKRAKRRLEEVIRPEYEMEFTTRGIFGLWANTYIFVSSRACGVSGVFLINSVSYRISAGQALITVTVDVGKRSLTKIRTTDNWLQDERVRY